MAMKQFARGYELDVPPIPGKARYDVKLSHLRKPTASVVERYIEMPIYQFDHLLTRFRPQFAYLL